jgi:hypothetical protein
VLWFTTGPVPTEPLVPVVEIPGPVSVQLFARVVVHVMVAELPLRTRFGVAVIEIAGLITVADTDPLPPFEQTTVYVTFADGVIVVEPLGALPVLKFELELLDEFTHAQSSVILFPFTIVMAVVGLFSEFLAINDGGLHSPG